MCERKRLEFDDETGEIVVYVDDTVFLSTTAHEIAGVTPPNRPS
jgi:uncharacterized protein YdeI (BOF family)